MILRECNSRHCQAPFTPLPDSENNLKLRVLWIFVAPSSKVHCLGEGPSGPEPQVTWGWSLLLLFSRAGGAEIGNPLTPGSRGVIAYPAVNIRYEILRIPPAIIQLRTVSHHLAYATGWTSRFERLLGTSSHPAKELTNKGPGIQPAHTFLLSCFLSKTTRHLQLNSEGQGV